jgi:hypothetical protein
MYSPAMAESATAHGHPKQRRLLVVAVELRVGQGRAEVPAPALRNRLDGPT